MNIDNLIMTTRIRLARNIDSMPFNTNDKDFFINIAKHIISRSPNYIYFSLSDLQERNSLYEQHLISAEFLNNTAYGVLITRKDNKVSIMLGEEDHIRIQAINNKFDLTGTYQSAKEIADKLEQDFKIAKNEKLGYLTKCPTNLGGGMRASVMIYLPALTITKKITEAFNKVDNNKITIRGVYGEGSISSGCIYQISNQSCVFMKDAEILSMIENIVNKLASIELEMQMQLWNKSHDHIIDSVMRSWGILTNAHMISSKEATEQLVWIKLGVGLKILSFKNDKIIDDLFFIIKPATLTANDNLKISDQISRDKVRALRIKEKLLLFRIK